MHHQQNRTIGRQGKYCMKAQECVETPLMHAFWRLESGRRKPANPALRQFDLWRIRFRPRAGICPAFHLA
jgi:hypothetical protein